MYYYHPAGVSGKESTCQCRRCKRRGFDPGSGSGISPGVGNGTLLQYSCLENSTDKGAWRATVLGAAKSDATEHTNTHTHTHVTSASIFILKQCVNSLWSHSTKNNEASGTLQAWRAWHHVLLCLFFFNIYLFGCIRSYCGTWDRLLRHGLSTWCTEHAGLAAVACGLSCSVAYGILVPQPRFRPMHCAVNS